MGAQTGISWTDSTWNPVKGCSRITPGCGGANHEGGCYAEKIAARFSGPGQAFEDFAKRTPHGGQWTGKLALASEDVLSQPLRWKKPRRIFVNSMSDLFHENLSFRDIAYVFHIMTGEASASPAPLHTYQILTKRSARMLEFFGWLRELPDDSEAFLIALREVYRHYMPSRVWLGVSVEDRDRKERIADLQEAPAGLRFLSCEPLLENLGPLDLSGISWVIVGGESGPRARPFCLDWARVIRDQCQRAAIPFFMKQVGSNAKDASLSGVELAALLFGHKSGADPAKWPADLRIQQFPT